MVCNYQRQWGHGTLQSREPCQGCCRSTELTLGSIIWLSLEPHPMELPLASGVGGVNSALWLVQGLLLSSCASPASELLTSRTKFYIYISSAAFSYIFPSIVLLFVWPWGTSSVSTSHWQNSHGLQCKLNSSAETDMSFGLCDGFWSLISICCPLLYKTKWQVSKRKDYSFACVFSNHTSNK